MKVQVRGGRVVDMTQDAGPPAEADGENVGIARFGAAGAPLLVEELDAIVGAGGACATGCRAPSPRSPPAAAARVGTRGFPWIEIDFPEDY